MTFGAHEFGDPKHTVEECKAKDINYQAPLLTEVRFVNKETGEMKEQVVFMGDFPLMTDPRHLHHQRLRARRRLPARAFPGRVLRDALGPRSTRTSTSTASKFIPSRGAWLEFEIDKSRPPSAVRIDRKRKQSVTHLPAWPWAWTESEIRKEIVDCPAPDLLPRDAGPTRSPPRTKRSSTSTSKLRPGEPPNVEAGQHPAQRPVYFNPQRYDLAAVGRYKLNKKLGLDVPTATSTRSRLEDIVAPSLPASPHRRLPSRRRREGCVESTSVDHFGNRRVRTVGELIARTRSAPACRRMERVVRERMTSQEIDDHHARSR